ncbi:MAG: hypothetical protein WAN14_24800 [Candidatus Acidiferrales bacterium]
MPETLRLDGESFVTRWTQVSDLDGHGLDRRVRELGWTFFYSAGEIKKTIFGFDAQKTVPKAVKRILASLKREKFNSLEVTQVVSKHFLGVPCTQVYAHPRHVQKSMFLFRDEDLQDWEPTKIPGDAKTGVVRAKDQILSLEEIIPHPNVATS